MILAFLLLLDGYIHGVAVYGSASQVYLRARKSSQSLPQPSAAGGAAAAEVLKLRSTNCALPLPLLELFLLAGFCLLAVDDDVVDADVDAAGVGGGPVAAGLVLPHAPHPSLAAGCVASAASLPSHAPHPSSPSGDVGASALLFFCSAGAARAAGAATADDDGVACLTGAPVAAPTDTPLYPL